MKDKEQIIEAFYNEFPMITILAKGESKEPIISAAEKWWEANKPKDATLSFWMNGMPRLTFKELL
jgi:hypothetical protein